MTLIPVASIRTDGGTQPRATLHRDWIEEYAADMTAGAKFPPVVVFYDGADYWLADGFHRVGAAAGLGLAEIEADVRQGTRRDAVLFSVGANGAHGQRRTNEDKRRAVLCLLTDAEWRTWSFEKIARQCGVDTRFVSRLNADLSPDRPEIAKPAIRTVTRNGVTYEMNTENIWGGLSEPDTVSAFPCDSSAFDIISEDLGLRGRVLRVGWELPQDLTEQEWQAAGELLGKVERSVSWWLGDWWAFGEARYGERKAVVTADDWEGPSFQTCADAASVCRAFETSRRHEVLTFKHHREVASLPPDQADELLDWAEETIAVTGKPRPTRELRAEVGKRRNAAAIGASTANSNTCTVADLQALATSGAKFGCIYADPPWLYDNQGTRAATGNHYSGMTVSELCALPIAAGDAPR